MTDPTDITATMLYNLVQCPKRVEMDLFGDVARRDAVNPFIQMLWERGTLYEQEVMASGKIAALDLSPLAPGEKEQRTREAMMDRAPMIYGGRISADGLLGMPDLLCRVGDGYFPMDIKAGQGEESGDDDESDGKPKLHYAVQLALYVDILERIGLSADRRGVIFDVHANRVEYDLAAPRGPKTPQTLWEFYQSALADLRQIVAKAQTPRGALASACKLCHWYSACNADLRAADDLTLVAGLGRSLRDAMAPTFPTMADLAAADPADHIDAKGKTPFKGVAEGRMRTFQARAALLKNPDARPYLKAPVVLPRSKVELFFDIEVDPMRDITYLHGIVERRGGDTASETFFPFFAEEETAEAERAAFADAYALLTRDPDATIWYYSKYERTQYRKLQARYPEVCSADAIEALFNPARAIDLYNDVVTRATEWPTHDQSIKTLAKYLGFTWRDTNPSGAASIEWFDQWVKTRDPEIRQRILDYNEDDCVATRVLLDGIRELA